MPPGPKKRKAAKRKNEHMTVDIDQNDYPTDPNANPNSGFFSPLLPPQGNSRDKRLALIDDEGDETFETPRFQPQTPRLPETPYYSMENVRSGKSCEIEGSIEENALFGEKFKGLSVETPLKETKLDVSVGAAAENSNGSRQEISSEEGEDGGQYDEGLQEAKLDKFVHVTKEESSKGEEAMLGKLEKLDKYVPVDEKSTPKLLIESVDVLSSNEKEVVHFESEGFINFRRNVEREARLNKPTFVDNGDLIDAVDGVHSDAERELYSDKVEEGKEFDRIHENYNDVVESVPEKLPKIDLDMTNNNLEKSIEESYVPVEYTARSTEELSQGNKADQENAAEPSSHIGKTEAAQRNAAARGQVVARRATFWNCCGLLEVFTSPDR